MQIEIALPSDENYVCGLRATAISIALYANKDVTLSYHILDGGIHDATFNTFVLELKRYHPHVIVTRHLINEDLFSDFPEWAGNRMTYARLLLVDLLPCVEFIIYCDTDFLWLADIAELWTMKDSSIPLMSTVDDCKETLMNEEKWFVIHGFPFSSNTYICAGLSFYNLAYFRKYQVIDAVRIFLKQYPDIGYADQTAMNIILQDKIFCIDQSWQKFTRDVKSIDFQRPIVLHYAGEVPWKRDYRWASLTDTVLLWHRFNAMINHTTLYRALRLFFTPSQIIFKRAFFLAYINSFTRRCLYRIFSMTNRHSLYTYFSIWNRKVGYKMVNFPKIISSNKSDTI